MLGFGSPETLRALGVRSPVAPPQAGDQGLRFGTLEAVVGVHIRMEVWGCERGVAPRPPRRVERLAIAAVARYRSGRRVGASVGGEEPQPRKARGPSSRPAPRVRVTPGEPLRAGCTPALVGRGWRAGRGDHGGAPETLAVLGFGSPGTLRALGVRSPVPRPKTRDQGLRFGTLEAVVGVHFRIDGWGLGAGELPHILLRRVGRLAMAAFARYRSERQGGAGVGRGRAPAPKSWGPLLPSRTPTPRNTAACRCGRAERPPLPGADGEQVEAIMEVRPKPSRGLGFGTSLDVNGKVPSGSDLGPSWIQGGLRVYIYHLYIDT